MLNAEQVMLEEHTSRLKPSLTMLADPSLMMSRPPPSRESSAHLWVDRGGAVVRGAVAGWREKGRVGRGSPRARALLGGADVVAAPHKVATGSVSDGDALDLEELCNVHDRNRDEGECEGGGRRLHDRSCRGRGAGVVCIHWSVSPRGVTGVWQATSDAA